MSIRLDERPRAAKMETSEAIRRWVRAGLISKEQGDAILRSEAEWTGRVAAAGSRVPLVAEVLAYIGAALALAAIGVLLRQHWHELAPTARFALAAAATALFALGGWLLRGAADPALQRLAGVLWLVSAGTFAGTVAILVVEAWGPSDATTALTASMCAMAYTLAVWAWRPRALQLLALAGAGLATVGSILALTSAPATAVVLSVWAFGLAWFVATWRRILRPADAGFVAGALALLVAPWISDLDWPAFLGLATAVGLMAASVALHQTPLLVLGAIGLFGFLTRTIAIYFAGTVGVPMALLLAGVLLVGVALVTARLYRAAPRGRSGGQR